MGELIVSVGEGLMLGAEPANKARDDVAHDDQPDGAGAKDVQKDLASFGINVSDEREGEVQATAEQRQHDR